MRRTAIASILAAVCAASGPAPAADLDGAYFSRRLGGPEVSPQRIAVAADGTVYVAGETTTFDLPGTIDPPTGAGQRYFVTSFSRAGDARWTTYFELDTVGHAAIRGLAVGSDGAVWVVATQGGVSLYQGPPEPAPGYLFPVVKLAPTGAVEFTESFGGTLQDRPTAIAPTADGDLVIVGGTCSPDFPVVNAHQPLHGDGGLDGFAMRVRGDGSGIVWSTFLGGTDFEAATALAVDATGDVLVARHTRGPQGASWAEVVRWDPVVASDLVRLRADGSFVSATPLARGDAGAILAVAAPASGPALVAGAAIFGSASRDSGVRRGFVAAATGASDPTPLWRQDGVDARAMGLAPGGEVVATLERPGYSGDLQSVVVLSPDLEFARTLLEEDEARSVACTAVGADGAVCFAGRGLALAYGPGSTPLGARDAFVATMPVSGAAPARDVLARRPRERSVELAWQGGDAVLRYEVERLVGEEDDAHYELATAAPASARGARVHGLRPGSTTTMRVVSVFASGARSASAPLRVSSRPAALANATAAPVDGSRIRVSWSNAPHAPDADFEIERQLGDAPFRRIPWSPYWPWIGEHARDEFFDALPPLDRLPVRYRVRAVTTDPRVRSPWTYTPAVETLRSNLVVRQVRGSVTHFKGDLLRIRIEGSYATPGETGGAAGFDPLKDEISIIAGDADRPLLARVSPRSYESFSKLDDDWYRVIRDTRNNDCQIADYGLFADYSWYIDFHPARGRFEILAYACTPLEFRPSSDRIVLGLAYGDRAGGELRTWSRHPGPGTNLELR